MAADSWLRSLARARRAWRHRRALKPYHHHTSRAGAYIMHHRKAIIEALAAAYNAGRMPLSDISRREASAQMRVVRDEYRSTRTTRHASPHGKRRMPMRSAWRRICFCDEHATSAGAAWRCMKNAIRAGAWPAGA